jgi:hypothetical protein
MAMPPAEPALPVDTCGALLTNALIDGGIVGVDEAIEPAILNRAFTQANWLLAQWARKRWLVYRIQDYSFVCTGALNYSVGLGQTVNINPRPDRLEYAFLRFLNQSPPSGLFVDIPLDIIQSHEDYSRIAVKNVGTLAWRIFYDPVWPVGLLFPWPVPQSTIYEIHVGFKVVLPRFSSIQQPINFPPEYESAMNWCLARRFRATYQMPADPEINALARDALNVIRLANQAVGVLRMPSFLRNRNRGYDYRGDSDSY